jgi:hypothetical protein
MIVIKNLGKINYSSATKTGKCDTEKEVKFMILIRNDRNPRIF